MAGFLGWEGTLLAHVQLAIQQYLQVFWDRPMLSLFIPQHVLVVGGFSCPTYRTLHLDLVNLMGFTCACCLSLSRSLCLVSRPSGVSAHSLVSSANFLRVHSTPLMMLLMKILKSVSLSMDPCGTTLITNCHPDMEPLTAALWTQSCSRSLSIQQSTHRIRIFPSFPKQLPKTQSNQNSVLSSNKDFHQTESSGFTGQWWSQEGGLWIFRKDRESVLSCAVEQNVQLDLEQLPKRCPWANGAGFPRWRS
ncbi:uncharacterized protein LOC112532911 [Gallus gallus]|uniref:uncharacterized protein LOC112532911 n=1 Tax=Gallus gallus TaxID=9031 RepID=UPI001AE8176C|nr:uncharacterized protein LOC112532911 [Gallus gallus]